MRALFLLAVSAACRLPEPLRRLRGYSFRVRYYSLGRVEPSAGVRVEDATEHYLVRGRSVREVTEDLRRQSYAQGEPGEEFVVGRCVYEVLPEFRIKPVEQDWCELEAVAIRVPVRIILPRWEGEAPEIAPRWRRFVSAIRDHEESHRAEVIRSANELRAALMGLGRRPCGSLGEEANALVRQAAGRTKRRQEDYHRAVRAKGETREF